MSPEKPINLEAIGEKLDQILAYQRSQRHWAIFRSVINTLLFLIFVVFPIVGGYYLIRGFASQVDFTKLAGQYHQAIQMLDQVNTMQGQLKEGAVQDLLQKIPNLK